MPLNCNYALITKNIVSIKAVEQNAIEDNRMNDDLKKWLIWIKDKADWYDPLIEKEDELFKDIDRDILKIKTSYW